ncbi:UNVERIFIED_ORG: hypothetical protein M2328_003526 [Rhodococcus erythropolis]
MGPTPKGYNAVQSNGRIPLSNSALQKDLDRHSLLWTAARIFINQLGMPLLPDWGIRPNGECQCPGKRLSWNRVRPGDPNDTECRSKPGKHPCAPLLRGGGLYPSAEADLRVISEWIAGGRNIAAIPYGHIVIDIDDGGMQSFVQ